VTKLQVQEEAFQYSASSTLLYRESDLTCGWQHCFRDYH